jgi:hypothetical protein
LNRKPARYGAFRPESYPHSGRFRHGAAPPPHRRVPIAGAELEREPIIDNRAEPVAGHLAGEGPQRDDAGANVEIAGRHSTPVSDGEPVVVNA